MAYTFVVDDLRVFKEIVECFSCENSSSCSFFLGYYACMQFGEASEVFNSGVQGCITKSRFVLHSYIIHQ